MRSLHPCHSFQPKALDESVEDNRQASVAPHAVAVAIPVQLDERQPMWNSMLPVKVRGSTGLVLPVNAEWTLQPSLWSHNMRANSGKVCGVLDIEFGRVASPVVAPQDRALRMHAVDSMACFICSERFLTGGRGFTAPGYRRPTCKETPNGVASARNRCWSNITPLLNR